MGLIAVYPRQSSKNCFKQAAAKIQKALPQKLDTNRDWPKHTTQIRKLPTSTATATPRATLDVEGEARLKSYTELPVPVGSSSGIINLDLTAGQTFTVTTTEDITEFRCSNFSTSMATAFTIKIVQGTTARNVGIDTFKTSGGVAIPVYWPGGIEPTVTKTASAIDIYSFMTFDGGSTLYGVVGGQNFS